MNNGLPISLSARPMQQDFFTQRRTRGESDTLITKVHRDEEDSVTETSTGIEVGQKMPAFELPDQEGQLFNLTEQLGEGPLVLIFYRGDW